MILSLDNHIIINTTDSKHLFIVLLLILILSVRNETIAFACLQHVCFISPGSSMNLDRCVGFGLFLLQNF